MIRRTSEEVLTHCLPPRRVLLVQVPLTEVQNLEYQRQAKRLLLSATVHGSAIDDKGTMSGPEEQAKCEEKTHYRETVPNDSLVDEDTSGFVPVSAVGEGENRRCVLEGLLRLRGICGASYSPLSRVPLPLLPLQPRDPSPDIHSSKLKVPNIHPSSYPPHPPCSSFPRPPGSHSPTRLCPRSRREGSGGIALPRYAGQRAGLPSTYPNQPIN